MASSADSLRRLTGWFGSGTSKPKDPRGDLKKLPLEVTFMIVDLLDKPSTLSFLLTCKLFKDVFQRKWPKFNTLSPEDKRTFLPYIESRDPSYCYCHACNKLHTYKECPDHPTGSDWFAHVRAQYPDRDPGRIGRDGFRGFDDGDDDFIDMPDLEIDPGVGIGPKLPAIRCHNIDWVDFPGFMHSLDGNLARLIMNRHFYGEPHGYSLEVLALNEVHEPPDDLKLSFKRTARVLDDELYLRTTWTWMDESGDVAPIRLYLEGEEEDCTYICRHIQLDSGNLQGAAFEIIESIVAMLNEPLPKFGLVQTTRSCPTCMTDYEVTIARKNRRSRWRVCISVYQSYGSCRSDEDWKWGTMVQYDDRDLDEVDLETDMPLRDSDPRITHYDAGYVRRRWMQEDGLSDPTVSEFIHNVPNLHVEEDTFAGPDMYTVLGSLFRM